MLATTVHGPDRPGPPLLIAHGLFGSGRNWGVLARRLSADRPVLTVDMRNHGASFWDDDHRYPAMARDLSEVIAAHGGQADVLGHSMGGKAAMTLAVTEPERVRRLIVADIAPVPYDHSQQENIDAMRRVDLGAIASRADAAAQLGELPPGVAAFLLQSLDVKERRWRLNLDALEANMADILSFPEIDGRFEGPALFLAGAESSYVRPEHRSRIKALFPGARFAKIPGAGHWLHADKPRETQAAVAQFLAMD